MHTTLRLIVIALVSLPAIAAAPEAPRASVRLTPDMGPLASLLPAELKKAKEKKL